VIPAETLVELATLGLPKEQVERVAAMLKSVELATQEECGSAIASRRKADRERQQKHRSKSRDVTLANVTNVTERDTPPSREEYNTTRAPAVIPVGISNDIPPIEVNPHLPTVDTPPKSKSPSPKEILSEIVSEKTAADVIAHRKALRKPLTPRAAELLAKSLSASGDAEHAAATMIERGWQGYRADWDSSKPNARAGPNGRGGFATLLAESLAESHVERTEKKRTSEIVQLLPIGEHDRSGAGGDHDGGVSRNAVEVLVGNSFRRM
jgi:hypothetical protein